MATTRTAAHDDSADRIIDSLAEAERSALDAVRRFLSAVDNAFPHVGPGGGPRQKIIDSAFSMAEELVGTSNQFAHRLVTVGADAAARVPAAGTAVGRRAAGTRARARGAAAKKTTAKKATAKKTTAKKTTAKKASARKAPAR